MVSASTSSIAIARARALDDARQPLAFFTDQLFGVAQTGNAAALGENHRGGYHRSKQSAAADFIDAGNHLGAARAGSPFVAVSAHQRLEHAHLARCRGKFTLQRFWIYEILLTCRYRSRGAAFLRGICVGMAVLYTPEVKCCNSASPKSSVDHSANRPLSYNRVSHSSREEFAQRESTKQRPGSDATGARFSFQAKLTCVPLPSDGQPCRAARAGRRAWSGAPGRSAPSPPCRPPWS